VLPLTGTLAAPELTFGLPWSTLYVLPERLPWIPKEGRSGPHASYCGGRRSSVATALTSAYLCLGGKGSFLSQKPKRRIFTMDLVGMLR
jgi:hypothetical protein